GATCRVAPNPAEGRYRDPRGNLGAADGRPGRRLPRWPRRGHPVARPARAGAAGPPQPARLGGARLLDHARRRLLRRQPLPPARDRPAGVPAGHLGPGRAARVLRPRRAQGPAAPPGRLHPGVLGQHGPAVLHRRHRQRPLGRHAARARPAPGRPLARRHRGHLLGSRPRPDHHPRQPGRASAAGGKHREHRARRHGRPGPDDHGAVRPQHVRRGGARRGQPPLLGDERRAAAPRARLPPAPHRPGLVRHRERQVAHADRGRRPALRGPLHGPRVRHDPRAAGRRRDGLDVPHRRPRAPEVRAGEGHAPRQPLRRHGRGLGWRRGPRRGPGRRRPVAGGAPARGPPRTPARRVRLGLLDPAARPAHAGRACDPLASHRRGGQHPARARRPVPRVQAHVLGGQRPDHAPGADPGREL
ncbi:MAG: probable sulfite oxidase, partial [uncultured Solirubrobacteraceae bacterium]